MGVYVVGGCGHKVVSVSRHKRHLVRPAYLAWVWVLASVLLAVVQKQRRNKLASVPRRVVVLVGVVLRVTLVVNGLRRV